MVIYVVVTILHLANGFGIGASITGIYHDVRMVTTCPTNLSAVWRFIDRTPYDQVTILFTGGGEGDDIKEYLYSAYCDYYPVKGEDRPDVPTPTPWYLGE